MKQDQRKNGGIAAVLKSFNTQAILQMCDFQILLLQKSLKDFPFIIFDFFFNDYIPMNQLNWIQRNSQTLREWPTGTHLAVA